MSEQKRGRGQPRHYEENKQRRNLRITDTAWSNLGASAKKAGISRSELIERFARSLSEDTATSANDSISTEK